MKRITGKSFVEMTSKKMKKLLASTLALTLCAMLAACTPAAPATGPEPAPTATAANDPTPQPAPPITDAANPHSADAQASAESDVPAGKFSQNDLGIAIDGETYYLREDSADLLSALGSDYEYSEIVSCVYEGMDKTFIFPGIKVNTVPVDGKDVIEMLTLTDDTYATLRGIKIGQDLAAITDAYGSEYFDDGYVTYSLSNDPADIQSERIQFEFSGESVGTIYIYSPSY